MSLLRESCLYRLWLAFWASYLDSSLSRLIRRVENWCGRQVETSFLLQPLCREGVVARGWPDSLLCRLLNVIECFLRGTEKFIKVDGKKEKT